MQFQLKEVIDPADCDVEQFAALLQATFADGNVCLGVQRMREFLAAGPQALRSFHLVVAKAGDQVMGGSLFSSIIATGAGFSEYMVLDRRARGQGLSRLLFDYRKSVLDREAHRNGFPGATGLFIEVENPSRTPTAYAEQELKTAMGLVERWRYFKHLGFFRLDCRYVQPPLGVNQEPVTYLDLLFLPASPELRMATAISPDFLIQSLTPIWCAWAPAYCRTALQEFRTRLGDRPVPLLPLEPDAATTYGGTPQ